jgi:hypothetical protein
MEGLSDLELSDSDMEGAVMAGILEKQRLPRKVSSKKCLRSAFEVCI